MNLLPLPNHAARITATLDAQAAERASLMRRLQAAADSGDEGDGLARQIDDLDRDIARTRIKLAAAESAKQRDREVEQAKAQAKARKAAEKLLDKYQASAEMAERLFREGAEAVERMRADYAAFEVAHPQRDALALSASLRPTAMVGRLLEVQRERIARQIKHGASTMPASSARIERMSVADAFRSKRAGLLPWLEK
jgi:hypothetical protein